MLSTAYFDYAQPQQRGNQTQIILKLHPDTQSYHNLPPLDTSTLVLPFHHRFTVIRCYYASIFHAIARTFASDARFTATATPVYLILSARLLALTSNLGNFSRSRQHPWLLGTSRSDGIANPVIGYLNGQVTGLVHDLGKLLHFFGSEGQWDVVGVSDEIFLVVPPGLPMNPCSLGVSILALSHLTLPFSSINLPIAHNHPSSK